MLLYAVPDFSLEDEASSYCEYNDGENDHRHFSVIPGLKTGRYFTGITVKKAPVFSAAIFSVNPLNAAIFRLSALLILG